MFIYGYAPCFCHVRTFPVLLPLCRVCGVTSVFEHLSVNNESDQMCNKDNDLHNVLINCDQRIKLLHKSEIGFSSVSS